MPQATGLLRDRAGSYKSVANRIEIQLVGRSSEGLEVLETGQEGAGDRHADAVTLKPTRPGWKALRKMDRPSSMAGKRSDRLVAVANRLASPMFVRWASAGFRKPAGEIVERTRHLCPRPSCPTQRPGDPARGPDDQDDRGGVRGSERPPYSP